MAQENVKKFMDALASDAALAEKLKAKEMAYTGDTADKETAVREILLPLAAEAGYPFTLAELKADETETSGLSEDELAEVAGGKGVTSGGHCFGVCLFVGIGACGSRNFNPMYTPVNVGWCIVFGTTLSPKD